MPDKGFTFCGNCELVTETFLPLRKTPDLGERLDPGAEVPAGECLECGALVYFRHPHPMQEVAITNARLRLEQAVSAFDDWAGEPAL